MYTNRKKSSRYLTVKCIDTAKGNPAPKYLLYLKKKNVFTE